MYGSTQVSELTIPQKTPSVTPHMERWRAWPWKDIVGIGTPAALFVGVMMLYTYLIRINRVDLLQQAVASTTGLMLLVVWAVLTSVALIATVFGSLWFIDAAAATYNETERIPGAMPWLLSIGCLLWYGLVVAIYLVGFLAKHVGIVVATFMLLLVIGSALIHIWWQNRGRRLDAVGRGLLTGFLLGVAMALSLFAPLALLVVDPQLAHEEVHLLPALLWVGTAVPELVVGCALFWGVAKGRKQSEVRKKVALIVLTLTIAAIAATFHSVDMQVLRALGVYSTTEARFAIVTTDLAPSLRAAGFAISKIPPVSRATAVVNSISTAEDASVQVFDAFVRFHFGDQLVLCTTPYDPLQPPSNTVNAARCLDVRTGDVRRIMPNP